MTKAAKPQKQLIFVDGLEVWVNRKRVKNLSLYIKPPDGHIELTVPTRCSMKVIEDMIASKRSWIDRKQKEVSESIQSKAEAATKAEAAQWAAIVKAITPGLITKWESIMGVKAQSVVYRNMRSRWGSCQPSTGRICINTRLALYPPDCLEYVVVHELCHLMERGHGPRFYALMDRFLPTWKKSRAKLKS